MTFVEGEVMSESREVFLEALMRHILDLTMVPKVQVERVIGPILGLFIAELLSHKWGKQVEMICEEFPLRKDDLTCQSTNIDWLLYDPSEKQLVFLELKTACTSFEQWQPKIYLEVIEQIRKRGSSFLVNDLGEIRKHSKEREKYDVVVKRFQEKYLQCHEAKLVYLAPEAMRDAERDPTESRVEWLTFTDLPATITHEFAREWEIIRRHLVELDSKVPRAARRKAATA